MIRWSFDDDKLLDLVIVGKKRATCSVYSGKITSIGEESIITRDGKDAVKIRVTAVKVFKFKEAKEEDIIKEGEGNLETWRKVHIEFFKKYYPDFNDDFDILFEEFEVVGIYE
jgi:uncharacterized protein YhfF